MMSHHDQRLNARIRAAREAHIEAEIARIEAADEVVEARNNRLPIYDASRRKTVNWYPHDPTLAAQFAHLRTETFRRPEGYVAWGDEVPPGGDAA